MSARCDRTFRPMFHVEPGPGAPGLPDGVLAWIPQVEDDGRVADSEPLRSRAAEIFQSLRSAREAEDHNQAPDVHIVSDPGSGGRDSPGQPDQTARSAPTDTERSADGSIREADHHGEERDGREHDDHPHEQHDHAHFDHDAHVELDESPPQHAEGQPSPSDAGELTGEGQPGDIGEAWPLQSDSSGVLLDSTDGTLAPPAELTGRPGLPDLPPFSPPVATRAVHPGSLRPLPRIMAVANQKGGVGKTTTAVNLSAALAEIGYRVLVVDLDPQGNATTGLGINAHNLEHSVYDILLHEVPAEDVVEATSLRNLFVIPATIDLAGAEIELVPVFSRELRLRRALESVRADFDFILIDCPPSLGLLTVNGLAAATEVTVPIQCEYYALEGLSQLIKNVDRVRSHLNQGLEVSTIIMTMYDARTKLADQVVNDVRLHFSTRVCRNVVPRTVRLSEAPSFGQPIIVFDPSSRGAIAYRELAKEVSGGASQRAR
jgi:chromosome partitioning protein